MIVGLGIDLFEVARLERELERSGPEFLDEILLPEERVGGSAATWAACFAAKEAFVKAVGGGAAGGISWLGIRVSEPNGSRPELLLQEAERAAVAARGAKQVHVALTVSRNWAVAAVLLESERSVT